MVIWIDHMNFSKYFLVCVKLIIYYYPILHSIECWSYSSILGIIPGGTTKLYICFQFFGKKYRDITSLFSEKKYTEPAIAVECERQIICRQLHSGFTNAWFWQIFCKEFNCGWKTRCVTATMCIPLNSSLIRAIPPKHCSVTMEMTYVWYTVYVWCMRRIGECHLNRDQ